MRSTPFPTRHDQKKKALGNTAARIPKRTSHLRSLSNGSQCVSSENTHQLHAVDYEAEKIYGKGVAGFDTMVARWNLERSTMHKFKGACICNERAERLDQIKGSGNKMDNLSKAARNILELAACSNCDDGDSTHTGGNTVETSTLDVGTCLAPGNWRALDSRGIFEVPRQAGDRHRRTFNIKIHPQLQSVFWCSRRKSALQAMIDFVQAYCGFTMNDFKFEVSLGRVLSSKRDIAGFGLHCGWFIETWLPTWNRNFVIAAGGKERVIDAVKAYFETSVDDVKVAPENLHNFRQDTPTAPAPSRQVRKIEYAVSDTVCKKQACTLLEHIWLEGMLNGVWGETQYASSFHTYFFLNPDRMSMKNFELWTRLQIADMFRLSGDIEVRDVIAMRDHHSPYAISPCLSSINIFILIVQCSHFFHKFNTRFYLCSARKQLKN